MRFILPLVLTFLSFSVLAAEKSIPPAVSETYVWMTDANFKQEKTLAHSRMERATASSHEANDQLTSPEFKEARARFLKIESAQELKKLITEMNTNYNTYPDDLKLMTAMLSPILKFKAFTYKIYPFLAKEKITHSMMLSQVQNIAAFMNMNLPTAQWKAGFDLVTIPADEDDLIRFNNAYDLQNYLVREVYPAYVLSAQRIQALNFAKKSVVWDNKIFYGTASFSDNLNRFQLIGEGERYSILASLHYSLSDLCKFSAYDINEFFPLVREVAKLFGYDSVFSAVDGVNARKIAGVYRRAQFAKLFTLRKNGDHNMLSAFRHMKEGSRSLSLAWTELRDRTDNGQNFIRSAIFTPFTQIGDNQVEGMENVVSGKTSIRSDVTGEILTVDLGAFFANPPQDLKRMLPVGFDDAPNMQNYKVSMKNGKTQDVQFRNYFSGRATNWDVSAYKTLFPDLSKGNDVSTAMKILNQSVYGMMPAMIIQPFVML